MKIWTYAADEVREADGRLVFSATETSFYRWERHIDDKKTLSSIRETIRFGSGKALTAPMPLETRAKERISWV